MNFQSFQMEQTTLTLTQLALGAELLWEPKVGTAEHDRCVDAYIPGALTLQQKRATICIDFFNTVEATTMPYPFTRTYHISVPVVQRSPASLVSCDSFSSVVSSPISTTKPTGTKRPHDGPSASSKRLPGFSIMTRDGVDITDNQSRGPKTKEQREHAAKMRKVGACPACKRRKQKCEPSHHRPTSNAASVAATPMSSSMSARSSVPSLSAPSTGSRASISPQSSLESAFTPSTFNINAMPMQAVSKQTQPWEEGLLSSDLLDDEFMLHGGELDTFAFGQDMFNQDTSAGNWDFTCPTMGQDFDLFSYDNTLDFDASLYINTPSPLLQSSSVSPTSLQHASQAFSQSFMQSMDASQQPFAYEVNGPYSGNVDGAASEYGVALNSWDTGEFDSLEPDRPRDDAREPQEGAKVQGHQGLQSRVLSGKQQRSMPQSGDDHKMIDPRTDLLLESIASSPECSVLSAIQNAPKNVRTQTRGPTWASDPSQSPTTGSSMGSPEHQAMATGLLTPPVSQRSPVSEASRSTPERSPDVSFDQSARLENADRTVLAPGSGQPSVPSTSSAASFLDSFEDSSMRPTGPIWISGHDHIDQAWATIASELQETRPSAIQREAIQRHVRLSNEVAFTDENAPGSSAPLATVFNIAQTSTRQTTPVSSSTATGKTARKASSGAPAIRKISSTRQSTPDCGICPTAFATPHNRSTPQQEAARANTNSYASILEAAVARTNVAIKVDMEAAFSTPYNGSTAQQEAARANTNSYATDIKAAVARANVATKIERETLTEHTAAKTHSLSTSTFRCNDTPSVEGVAAAVAATKKLAETYGLVPSVVSSGTKAPVSYLDKLSNMVSSVFMQFSHGFRVGHSHARMQGKSVEMRSGRNLDVMMSGLRLC